MNAINKTASRTSRKWYFILPLILAAATIIAYYPSLTYDFQFDDVFNIRKFFQLRFIENWSKWLFNGTRWLSYILNTIHYHLDKFEPFVYRRSNMLIHTTTGILMFFVVQTALSRLKKRSFFVTYSLAIAFFTSLLFLLHPVQTQTVSYVIQGQLEGLANLFMMTLALCYLFYARATSWRIKLPLLILLFVLAILSCGTKEISVLSPVMLLLIDWFFVSEGNLQALFKKIPLFTAYTLAILSQYLHVMDFKFLGYSLMGKAVMKNNIGNVITATPGSMIKPFTYFISQFKVITHYIFMFFWPFNISVDYDWVMVEDFFTAECIIPLLFLLSLLAGTFLLLKKDLTNLIAFGSLWFFIGLAPRSTIIPSTELLVDYKSYFSSFGLFFLCAAALVYGFEWFIKKQKLQKNKALPIGATVMCMVLLGYATYHRNKVWESSEAFWFNVIENSPKKARAYNNYAVAIAEQKRFTEAVPYFRKAIKLDLHYPDPVSNLAVCYSNMGKMDAAIDCLRHAIQINPNYPEFYNNLSSFMLQKGQFEEVKKLAQHAIKLRPHYGKAFFNWGQALYNEGNKEEALEKIRHACLQADYDVPDSFKVYAELAVELQKYEDALVGYTHLFQLQPDNADAFFNIGNAHFFLQQYDQAENVYRTLAERDPNEHRSWLNLAEIYTRRNDHKQALICFEKAQPMASYFPEVVNRLAECKQRLATNYRAG